MLVALRRRARSASRLPEQSLRDLIDGVRMDVDGTSYATFDELVVYCRRVAGSIGRLCVAVFGSDDPRAGGLADDLGVALQLTNILRDVREDAERGRTYLPAEDLERFGAPTPATIGALVAFEAARAREWYARGLELIPLLDRRSAACVLAMSGIYRRLLDRIEADPRGDPRAAASSLGTADEGRRRAAQPARRARGERRRRRRRRRRHRRRARLRRRRRVGDARRGAPAPRRRRVLGRARRDSGSTTASTSSCAAAPPTASSSPTLGSEALVELQPRLEIPVLAPGAPTVVLRRSGARPPLHLARALLRYRHLSSARARRARDARRSRSGAPTLDDSRTLGDWLVEHGQSPHAIAVLWDLIALPTLNLPAAEASLALGAFVFQQGLLDDAAAGDIGLHRAPLQQIIGDPAARRARARRRDRPRCAGAPSGSRRSAAASRSSAAAPGSAPTP